MKKILSMLLCAALLLSCGVCAWAAEEPAGDHCHTVSDIFLMINNEPIDLSGVTLELDVTGVAGVDGAKAGRIHVNQDGVTVGELGVGVLEDGCYVLHLNSAALGHKDYGIDPVVLISRILRGGLDSLIELLQGIDTDAAAQSIFDGIHAQQAANDSADAEEAEETAESGIGPNVYFEVNGKTFSLSDVTIEGDAVALLKSCISEPETVHMGGVEYAPNGDTIEMPDGEYQKQTFTFDTDTVCELLDMVYVKGEPAGLGDEVRQAGVEILYTGEFYDGEAAHIGDIGASIGSDEFNYSVSCGYNQTVTDEGTETTFTYGTAQGLDPDISVSGVSFKVSDGTHEGEQFTPAAIDEDELVMLTDMELDEALSELSQALGTVLGDMLTPVMGPVMEAMPEGGDAAGIEEPAE